MNKRIVLEHSNGLRQICGILDIPEDTNVESQLLHDRLSWNLVKSGRRHVVYREVESQAASVSASGQIPTPTPEQTQCGTLNSGSFT